MAKTQTKPEGMLVKSQHPRRPGWDYFLLDADKAVIQELAQKPIFDQGCVKACTKVQTLLPKTNVNGQTGIGYQMVNIDGFRVINAFVISAALNSTLQRGFTLELSFALNDFIPGVGVVGETSFFFNCEAYYDPSSLSHKTVKCETNDLASTGGLPWIGGVDLTHVLRVPVLGPFVRASVFNEDKTAREVEVRAYLST
jgi:hypothetical protein